MAETPDFMSAVPRAMHPAIGDARLRTAAATRARGAGRDDVDMALEDQALADRLGDIVRGHDLDGPGVIDIHHGREAGQPGDPALRRSRICRPASRERRTRRPASPGTGLRCRGC